MKLPIIGRRNMPIPVVGALVKAAAEIKNIPVEIRQNHTDPIRAQRRELRKLLVKAQFTEFGKFYHFDEISAVEGHFAGVPQARACVRL